jgi:hypothetical protein
MFNKDKNKKSISRPIEIDSLSLERNQIGKGKKQEKRTETEPNVGVGNVVGSRTEPVSVKM